MYQTIRLNVPKNYLKLYHLSDCDQQFLYKYVIFSTSILCSEFGTDVDNVFVMPLKWNVRQLPSEIPTISHSDATLSAARRCGTIYFLSHVKLCVLKHKLPNCELTSTKFQLFSYRQPDKAQSCLAMTSPASPKASSSSSHVGAQDG